MVFPIKSGRKKNVPENVWKKIDIKSDFECWNYFGSLIDGY